MNTYRLKGASGKVTGMSFGLGARTLIGRADHCDVRVDDDLVAPQHAEIIAGDDGSLRFRHLAEGHHSRINGEVVQDAQLAGGDEIRVGNCRWVLQAPGLRPAKVLTTEAVKSRLPALPWLVVLVLLGAAALAWQRGWLPF